MVTASPATSAPIATSNTTSNTTPTTSIVRSALATPVGDGRTALVTARSLEGQHSGRITVHFSSGEESTGEIVSTYGGATIVAIDGNTPGHHVSEKMPMPSDFVTVLAAVPVDVRFSEVADLDVPEGTPIIDDDGHLIGICSEMPDGRTDLIFAETAIEPHGATTSVAP